MGCYTPQCAGTQDVMLPFNREKQYVKQVKDATESVFADIYIALGVYCVEQLCRTSVIRFSDWTADRI